MEGVGILEAVDVEVARLAGVVGDVEGHTPVETDDEESQVIAQADTSTDGNVVKEL